MTIADAGPIKDQHIRPYLAISGPKPQAFAPTWAKLKQRETEARANGAVNGDGLYHQIHQYDLFMFVIYETCG